MYLLKGGASMAQPKDEKEQRIYEELLEEYKDNKFELQEIEFTKNDSSDLRDWETIREEIRDLS